mmetsp:Transcript_61587/g.178667  ORF Transcript_61587/g.178667 Transcript_61587/m.178667 type:complete len:224 (-) Transcript_61587:67-738(-)
MTPVAIIVASDIGFVSSRMASKSSMNCEPSFKAFSKSQKMSNTPTIPMKLRGPVFPARVEFTNSPAVHAVPDVASLVFACAVPASAMHVMRPMTMAMRQSGTTSRIQRAQGLGLLQQRQQRQQGQAVQQKKYHKIAMTMATTIEPPAPMSCPTESFSESLSGNSSMLFDSTSASLMGFTPPMLFSNSFRASSRSSASSLCASAQYVWAAKSASAMALTSSSVK